MKITNLRALAARAFLQGAIVNVYNVVWQPYALALGASVPMLGLLASLGGWFGLVTNFVQPLGGWFADRVGRKPVLLVGSLGAMTAYGLFALAGATQLLFLFVIAIIFLSIASVSVPATASMTAESARVEKQGSAFSLTQTAAMVPGIITPIAGGALAASVGHASVFPILIGLEIATFLLIWRALAETRTANGGDLSGRDTFHVFLRAFAPPKGLRGFFLAIAMDSFFWGIGYGLLYGMLTDRFKFTPLQLGIMQGVTALSWAVMQLPIGRFLDKRGTRGMLIVSQALGIPLILVWMTQTQFEVFAINQVLFALTAATWAPVTSLHLTRAVPESERAEIFGRLNAFRGLIGFPSGAIAGQLYALGGMQLPLAVNLIGIVLIVAVLSFWTRDSQTGRA